MKIKGFREYKFTEYVKGMALQTFDVSLEFVINSGVHDFEIGNTEFDFLALNNRFTHFDLEARHKEKCRLAWFKVKKGERKKQLYGFLVYNSAMGFVDFLVNQYVPSGNTPLDKFMREEKKGKRTVKKLYRMLFDDAGHPVDKTVYYSVPAISLHILEYGMETIECHARNGRFFLKKMMYRDGRVFYLDECYQLDGHSIPTRRFFVYYGWEHPVFYWDGEELKHFFASGIGGLQQKLGSDVWEMFEERGRCKTDKSIQWFLPQQFKPEVIIRIPSKKEARPILRKGFMKLQESMVCPFSLFLFDTRSSLKLSGDIKFVTENPESLAILSRTIDNIYVPNDAPCDPAPLLNKNESFLVGVRPDV